MDNNLQELIQDARTALLFESPSPAVVDALSGTLSALVEALTTPSADDVRGALWNTVMNAIIGTHSAGSITDAILAAFEVRLRGTNSPNEAPQPLLNEFYASGLRRAIQIIQGEDYPLSNGLARVSSMVSDIEDEIAMQEDVQLSESDVVVRWLTAFAERGIVTVGGKGGALEAAREGQP